jgi:dihydrodipicolinate synthase/N-acetylneuraminate lyase
LGNGNVEPATIMKMADFEHVVAIKWGTAVDSDYDIMKEFSGIFNVIDNHSSAARCHKLGGRGYINLTAEVHPPHDLKIWELLESRRYEEAQKLYDKTDAPLRKFYAKLAEKSGGQARVKKGMMELMGHPMGASRPPSAPLSPAELAELREILLSFGWPVVK